MELTRKEEYRNRKVSVGITILSFIVMLLFLVFKNILVSNPSFTNATSNEVTMTISSESDANFNVDKKSPTAFSKKETKNSDQKIVTDPNSDMPVKSSASMLADKYRTTTIHTNNTQNNLSSENILPLSSEGNTNSLNTVTNTDAKFGFNLEKRSIVSTPGFTNDTKEQGKVVVEIVVDKEGNVIEANPNGRGTSTGSTLLKTKARQMAMATKFSTNQKIDEQRGTISIIFSFN